MIKLTLLVTPGVSFPVFPPQQEQHLDDLLGVSGKD
jgi:hypothetical protein